MGNGRFSIPPCLQSQAGDFLGRCFGDVPVSSPHMAKTGGICDMQEIRPDNLTHFPLNLTLRERDRGKRRKTSGD